VGLVWVLFFGVFFWFYHWVVATCWVLWFGSFWALFGIYVGLPYVYFLLYLEVYCAFFDIYIITYKKKKKFMPNLQTKSSQWVPISREDVLFPVAYTGEAAPWDSCI
jgi:hypothetical protein